MSSPTLRSPASPFSRPSRRSLSPSVPNIQTQAQVPQSHLSSRPPPPRLSSPHYFRDIFASDQSNSSSAYLAHPPSSNINFRETMQGVNRAIENASRAIQTAQEAFQASRTPSNRSNMSGNIVDLTQSPPQGRQDRASDLIWSEPRHRPDPELNRQPFQLYYGTSPGHMHGPSEYRPWLEPQPRPDDDTDSLFGPRRRFELQQRRVGPLPHDMTRTLFRAGVGHEHRLDEEAAIRRQHVARANWEQTQRRAAERRDRDREPHPTGNVELNRTPTNPSFFPEHQPSTTLPQPIVTRPPNNPNNNVAMSLPPYRSRSSSVEAIDLTSVDDDPAIAATLSKQRQDAIASQKTSSQTLSEPTKATADTASSAAARTPLTAYKCPICMEPPQNATTTVCGHLFCHRCIIDTLKWSEQSRRDDVPYHRKVKGVCPVCRKELARKEDPGPMRTLIPLEIKLISKREMALRQKLAEENERIEREIQARNQQQLNEEQVKKRKRSFDHPTTSEKGKGKVEELSSDDENNARGDGPVYGDRSRKSTKLRRDDTYDSFFDHFTSI